MRSLTTAQSSILSSRQHYTLAKVLVDKTGSLSYQDLTDLEGQNWVEAVQWTGNVDSPCATASLQLVRARDFLTLAPLIGFSKFNNGAAMLALRRRMKIQTATIPLGTLPQAADYQTMFEGYIDEIDPANETISVRCRDLGALLVDSWITSEKTYGAAYPTGVALATVIQGILNDYINTPNGWVGLAAITVTTVGTPNFQVNTYIQRRQSVMEAIRALANQIGWDVKYLWNGTAFELRLYQPTRGTTSSLRTFTTDDYYTISSAKQSIADIRNYIAIPYSDFDTDTRQVVVASDASSIALYGLRFMEISEASTSQINTQTEASRLATAALNDLKSPVVDQSIEMPYFWPVEVGDSYTWAGNNVHYDTAQQLAVVSYTHTISADECKTELQTRGVASGGYAKWLVVEGRSGVAPTAATSEPPAPVISGTAQGTPGTAVIIYDPPGPDVFWYHTEVWGKLDDGIAITQSQIQVTGGILNRWKRPQSTPTGVTLYAAAKKTRFEITGLRPGATYRFAIVIVDLTGNISQMATQTITVPAVTPYHESKSGQKDQLLRNPDFNFYTLGTTEPPDGWTYDGQGASVWSSSYVSTTAQVSGTKCLSFPAGAGASRFMISDMVPIAGGEAVTASAWLKVGVAGQYALLELRTYDANGTVLSYWGPVTQINHTNYTNPYVASYTTPTNARFVALAIACTDGYTLDRAYLSRAYSIGISYPTNSALPVGTPVPLTNSKAIGITPYSSGFTINVSGVYSLVWQAGFTSNNTAKACLVGAGIQVSTNGGSSWSYLGTTFCYSTPTTTWGYGDGTLWCAVDGAELQAGDIVRVLAEADFSIGATFKAGSGFFMVSQKQRNET